MALSELKLTTTGTQNPVVFGDLGARTFTHPTVDFDVLTEFSLEEIQSSVDMQTALVAGHITLIDEGGQLVITLEGVVAKWYKDSDLLRPIKDGTGFKFVDSSGTEVLTTRHSGGDFTFSVSGVGNRVLRFDQKQVRFQLDGVAGAESLEVLDSGAGQVFKVDSAGVSTVGGRRKYPAANIDPTSPAPQVGDRYFNTVEGVWRTYFEAPWSSFLSQETHRAQVMYGLFANVLEQEGRYSTSQVMVGLINQIYRDAFELPSPPPSGINVPAFAVVDDLDATGPKLAYWDHTAAQTGWILTQHPWIDPLLMPGHVLDQITEVGSGNSSYSYAMGLLIHLKSNAMVNGMAIKLGSAPHDHAWAIRRSTSPGCAVPPVSTFTDVLASGTHTYSAIEVWESVTGFPAAFQVAVDDWLACMVWIGSGGQTQNVTAGRDAGYFLEDYAEVHGGVYIYQAGPPPGAVPVPNTISYSTIYGIASVDLGAVP